MTSEEASAPMAFDVIIRGGTVVDGLGGEPYAADLGIADGKIAKVGAVEGTAPKEIDATGMLVTPGFVDVHTHYDGQAIWSERLSPSSSHGVTTVVMGNCGVGFAPCRTDDHDKLVSLMAGVEDIPGVVMAEGLPWTWETFPEFLDALESRPHDVDFAVYLPHSPLRVYVMGERGVNREPATAEDLVRMRALAREAAEVGAIGFATSCLILHKTDAGEQIPSWGAAEEELEAITLGLMEGGGTILQAVPELPLDGYAQVLPSLISVAERTGATLTFSLSTRNDVAGIHKGAMELVAQSNAAGGSVKAQVYPRPIGLIAGLELSAHPFVSCPGYRRIAHLPLAERVAELRKPEVRAGILSEPPELTHPLTRMTRNFDWLFPLGLEPDYEPALSTSIAASARARGITPEEEAYDRLLDDDGNGMLFLAISNFEDASLDEVAGLIADDDVVVGLGDGGAHYGMLCDASYTTFVLAYWTRDRVKGVRLSVPQAVKILTSKPADLAGLRDRGRIAEGFKADINIIDYDALRLYRPTIAHDLPGGGRRLDQVADGYVATIVSGEVIAQHGQPTPARPGRLIRGQRPVPC